MHTKTFLSIAEAAYVAGLKEPAITNAIRDGIVSAPLISSARVRYVSRLAAAFISFYCATDKLIPHRHRKAALQSSMELIAAAGKIRHALDLNLTSEDFEFDQALMKHIENAAVRSQKLDTTLHAISVSSDVMWGMPVFKGTRVLVETIVGSVEEGTSLASLKDSYAFLTEDLVDAAKIYTEIHPFQGRVQHISDSNPACKLKSVEIVHPIKNELAPIHRRMPVTKPGDYGT